MTLTHRFVSLTMLGAMALVNIPLSGAQETDRPSPELRREIHEAIRACRALETDSETQECISALRKRFQNAFPGRNTVKRKIADRLNIPEDARTALKACHEDNLEHEDKQACAKDIAAQYDFELPEHRSRMKNAQKIGHTFRSSIRETCGERENTDDWRECAKEARTGTFQELREDHPKATRRFTMRRRFKGLDDESKQDLKTCRQLETRDEKKACFDDVRDNLDTE